MDELLEVLNPDGTGTGIAKPRKQIKIDGDWHALSSIWIQNSKGELLLQKRTPRGGDTIGLWAATGGHVQFGDTALETIVRELEEELGLIVSPSEISLFFTQKFEGEYFGNTWRMFRNVWYMKKDIDITDLKYQPSEVQLCAWKSIDEIRGMFDRGEMFDYGEEYQLRIFSLAKNI